MIDLLIPVEVPSMNKRERMHWRAQRREVQTWMTWFMKIKRAGGLDDANGPRRVMITAFRTQRCRDHANLVGGCKGLCDGLVKAKLLIDDDDKNMTAEYHQDVASKSPTGKPSTRIIITDITTTTEPA